MKVDDEIYLDKSLSPPFGSNVNIDQVTHQGIESEIRATPVEYLELFATHTFTRAEITQAANPAIVGNKYPVTPRLQGTVGGTVHYERSSFTLLGRYVGERLLVGDFFNTAEPLPSYWVMDARAAYTYNSFTGFASVYNLADRKFMDNAGLTSAGTIRYNPAPGRSYLIGGEFRF
jgi:iron complex outermembrane receptor protein